MTQLDLTLPSPEENLALDEALLDACEEDNADEVLRFWEPKKYFVVVGYANECVREANLPYCDANRIPVLRRCTGGGTVLQGPGCLNYTLVLRIADGPLSTISGTNEFVLGRHREALSEALGKPVEMRGQTDLAIGELKFSGNAQRRKKNYLIYHGTFLLNFNLAMITDTLPMPSKQPEYRHHRAHAEFLVNLDAPAQRIKQALREAWTATDGAAVIPSARMQALVQEKYGSKDWNRKF